MLPTSRIARFSLWVTLLWIAIFWRLWYLPLLDPDEAHYAELTREMMRLGDYVVSRMDGIPLIDKPVLFHWIQAGSFRLFGENELAARLPTALAALALIWTTYWLGKRLFSKATAERAALMLVLMPLTFALSRFAYFDMIFNAFLFGAIALLAVAAKEQRRALQIPGFILLSLAAQVKGPFVFIIFVGAVILAALSKETRVYLKRIAWIPGLIGAGVLALPWFVMMWRHFGDAFIRDYVLYNNLQLFAAPLYRKSFHPFFYFRSGAASLFPWSLLLIGAAFDAWRHRRAGQAMEPRRVILWSWTITVFVFFSASRFKLDHYIYPIAPAVCLLVADVWERSTSRWKRAWWPLVAALVIIFAVAVQMGLPYLDSTRPGARLGVWLSSRVKPEDHVVIFNQGRWKASFRYYADHNVQQTTVNKDLLDAWRLPKRVYGVMVEKDLQVLKDAGLPFKLVHTELAAVGNTGRGLIRKQVWGEVYVVTNEPPSPAASANPGPPTAPAGLRPGG